MERDFVTPFDTEMQRRYPAYKATKQRMEESFQDFSDKTPNEQWELFQGMNSVERVSLCAVLMEHTDV